MSPLWEEGGRVQIVHSCFVDDTFGEKFQLIGANGCAVDRNLVTNLEYPMGSLL